MARLYFCYLAIVSIIIFGVSACTSSYKSIYIETAKPSESILPEDIQSLTLMNRSITDDFKNYNRDTLQQYIYNKDFLVNNIILDSIAADTTLRVLGELLYESGRYDIVIPKNHNIYRGLKFYKLPHPLEWKFVKNTCELYETDALLVIERYINKVMTKYKVTNDFYSGEYIHEASIDSKYDAILKIYDPRKQEVVKNLFITDTIFWYKDELSQKRLFAGLPKIKDVLIQTGIKLALDADSKLSPSWTTEERGYFTIDSKADTVLTSYINKGDWLSAYNYWEKFANSTNKNIRSKAEYNLALASEMQGHIEKAIEWANKSFKTQYRMQADSYLRKLGERRKLLKKYEKIIK